MSEEDAETPKLSGGEIAEASHENTEEIDKNVDIIKVDDQLKEDKEPHEVETDTSTVDVDKVKESSDEVPDDEVKESQEIQKLDVQKYEEECRKEEIDIPRWLVKFGEFGRASLHEHLQKLSEDELKKLLEALKESNAHLVKENDVYEFILNEDESVQNTLEILEREDHPSIHETPSSILSYPEKTYFARKKLQSVEEDFELKKAGDIHELQNLQFKLESLNISLKDLKEEKEKFDKNVRIGGRHPVTRKIIQQKVAKYFDDSIGTKMALLNRYKIQVQSDIMVRNKVLCQIKAQEKRLASLDLTEFQETQFHHMKTCRILAIHKEKLAKIKSKYSPLLQSLAKMKKALEEEKCAMEKMQIAVSKQEHLRNIVITEKARNDQKIKELKAAMRKIKLDPRRHNLPEVIEYAAVKKENATLKKNIKKWQKKVALAEQAKLLHLSALQKEAKEKSF